MADNPLSPTWYFSNSQLSLYQLCPRRYYEVYLCGRRESPKASAEFSTLLVHDALVRRWVLGEELTDEWWNTAWSELSRKVASLPAYASVPTAMNAQKAILATYPTLLTDIKEAECKRIFELAPGVRYYSRPDFLTDAYSIDLKWSTAREYPELASFDPQFVGQAVATGRDTFARLMVWLQYGKKRPEVVLEEMPLLETVVETWREEQLMLIEEIKESVRRNVWPKQRSSCGAFGVKCDAWSRCLQGGLS